MPIFQNFVFECAMLRNPTVVRKYCRYTNKFDVNMLFGEYENLLVCRLTVLLLSAQQTADIYCCSLLVQIGSVDSIEGAMPIGVFCNRTSKSEATHT